MKLIRLLLLVVLTICNLTSCTDGKANGVVDKAIIELQGSEEDVNRSLELLKDNYHKKGVIELSKDIWEKNTVKYPQFNWKVLGDDINRLKTADIIIHAVRNNLDSYDNSVFRSYARCLFETSNIITRKESLRVIGLLDSNEDVEYLRKAATDIPDILYSDVIAALLTMCNPNAEELLLELIDKDSDLRRQENDRERYRAIKKFKKDKLICNPTEEGIKLTID